MISVPASFSKTVPLTAWRGERMRGGKREGKVRREWHTAGVHQGWMLVENIRKKYS